MAGSISQCITCVTEMAEKTETEREKDMTVVLHLLKREG